MVNPTHLYAPFQVQSLSEPLKPNTAISGVESEGLNLDPWWSWDSEVSWASVSSSGPVGNKPMRGWKRSSPPREQGRGAVVSAGHCGSLWSTSGHYCEWIWFLGHLMYSQGSLSTGFPVVWCIIIFRIFLCIRIGGFNIWNVSLLIKGVDFAIRSVWICIPTLRLLSWETSREWLNLSVPLCLIPQNNTISNYLVEVFKEVIVWLHGCS